MSAVTNPEPPRDAPSVDQIRRAFPALARRENGLPVAYFDGPGGTQVPQVVADAVADYLLHHNANTHWAFPTSAETDAALSGARRACAELLGAAPDEIAFGANMTTLTFHVARALGRGWRPGDEIVVTDLDHQANIAPWHDLARERGLRVRTVPLIPADGTLDWEAFESLVTERTRLVAIGGASNAIGTINDLPRAVELAQRVGALAFVDGVHSAAHAKFDFAALGCDLFACSPYKFYGPHLGILAGRRELIAQLDVPRLPPACDEPPERLETGTLSHEAIVGAGAAVDFLASLGTGPDRPSRLRQAFATMHRRSAALFARAWSGLAALPGVRLFGPLPGAQRTPTLAFVVKGWTARDVARRLARQAVFVSHGDFYAPNVIAGLGLTPDGVVRAGCAVYTTTEEIDRLVEGVRTLR
jgi:cysteine desulfurase family protein (TIGR01976 family)